MFRLNLAVRILWLLAPALALAGCASGYGAPINGDRALSPEEQRLQAVETKQADLSRRFNASEANRDQKVSGDIGSLRGQVEQLRYDLDNLQKRDQDQMQAFETRIKALEVSQQSGAGYQNQPQPSQPSYQQVPDGASGSQTPVTSPTASSASDEEAMYLRSFDLLKAAKYDDAIRGFSAMLAKYPQGNYSDNALYWTGESYNIKKDSPNALASYRSLLEKFPASPKVPDALLKTGIILQDQNKSDQARTAYQRVIKEFPNSSSATQARNRLAQLR